MQEQEHTLSNSWSIDILPRVIAIIGLLLSGQLVLNAFQDTDIFFWQNELENNALEASIHIEKTLNENTQIAMDFAEDERIAQAFQLSSNLETQVRRPLFEFYYIQKPTSAYIFDAETSEIISQTSNAVAIPANVINNLIQKASLNRSFHNDVLFVNNDIYILFAGAIISDTGTVEGYTIFTKSFADTFTNAINQIRLLPTAIQYDLYRLGNDENAILFEEFSFKKAYARQVIGSKTPAPIFAENFETNTYNLPSKGNTPTLTAMKRSEIYDNWSIMATIPESKISSNSSKERTIVWSILAALIVVVLLLPIKGAYTNNLKRAFNKILTVISKKPAEISQDELNRMAEERNKVNLPLNTGAPRRKLNITPKPRPKEKAKPSDASIAYNIRTGMKNKRVKLMYQPIFETASHAPVMYETYMRVVDEDGSIIPPALWLPVAKKENLFSTIDETVLSIASQRFFMGREAIEVPFTFNISGSTFESLEFVNSFANVPGVATKTIFEISSKEIIEDPRAMKFIRDCRNLGFRFSIDYFGGGVETIKVAKKLKFDFIKVNAFRFNLSNEKDVKELIILAKTAQSVGIPMVMERIEDKKMYNFCKKVGIPYVQGYYLAKPNVDLLPKEELSA